MFLTGPICDDSTVPICAAIMEYNLMDPAQAPESLTLIINSPGGHVSSALHLIDMMKTSEIPIITFGMGEVISAGLFIFMAGEKGHRYITQNTILMSHQYSAGSIGKEHELFSTVKDFELTSAKIINHYKKCTKKTETYIRKHLLPASDCWLSPEEAVKHGIADSILETY